MTGWPTFPFLTAVVDQSGGNIKTLQSDYQESGQFAIVDQGKDLVGGYTDDSTRLCRSAPPVIVFGDHTRALKYVDFPFGMGADGVKVLRVRDGFDTKFVYHYLRWLDIPSAGYSRHFKFLKEHPVPRPPLDQQRRIAAILDQADALRAKRRDALAHLDDLTQSIFLDMFGDPITNDRGWPTLAFGEVCQTRLGKMLDAKQQTGKHVRPYLRNANVQWFEFDLEDILAMDFDPAARALFRLREGDLLICEGGRPGRAAIWRGDLDECYYQKALHRARPLPDRATPEYLAFLLWFLVERGGLSDHISSATIAHLTSEKLKAMLIPLPPLAIQNSFAERVAVIGRNGAAGKAQIVELDHLFASLQSRAFAGEL